MKNSQYTASRPLRRPPRPSAKRSCGLNRLLASPQLPVDDYTYATIKVPRSQETGVAISMAYPIYSGWRSWGARWGPSAAGRAGSLGE
jgi:hypothetical protein